MLMMLSRKLLGGAEVGEHLRSGLDLSDARCIIGGGQVGGCGSTPVSMRPTCFSDSFYCEPQQVRLKREISL
jgi:hypothetical protein